MNIHKKVQSLINEKKAKINDKQFFTSQALRRHFEDIAYGITKKFGKERISVDIAYVKDGDTAYTTGKRVYINADDKLLEGTNRAERYKLVYGLFSHESGHILYTDFTILKKMKENILTYHKFYPDFPKEARYDAEVGEIKTYLMDTTKASIIAHLLLDLHNIVEDGHIENRMMFNYTGDVKRSLLALRKVHLDAIPTVSVLEAEEEKEEDIINSILQNLLSYAKYGEIKFGDADVSNERIQAVFSLLDDVDAYMITNDALKRAEIGNLIFIKLWCYYKPLIDLLAEQSENNRQYPQQQGSSQQGSGGTPMASSDKSQLGDTRKTSQTRQIAQNSSSQSSQEDKEDEKDEDNTSSAQSSNQPTSQKDQNNGESQSDEEEQEGDTQPAPQTDTDDEDSEADNGSSDDSTDESESEDNNSDDNGEPEDNSNEEDQNEGDDSTNGDSEENSNGDDNESDDGEDNSDGGTDENNSDDTDTEELNSSDNEDDADDTDNSDSCEDNSSDSSDSSQQTDNLSNSNHGAADDVNGNGDFSYDDEYEGNSDFDTANAINDILEEIAEEKANETIEKEIKSDAKDIADSINYGNIHKNCDIVLHRQVNVSDKLIETYQLISPELLSIAKGLVKTVQQKLKDYQQGGKFTNLYFGRRIDKNNLVHTDGKIFYNNRLPQDLPQLSVGVLVDESYSMLDNNRSVYARATAIIVYEFCQQLHIPITIIGHSADDDWSDNTTTMNFYDYCEFDSTDGKDKYRLMDIKARGCTRDGAALRYIMERLVRRPEEQKILFVISDGEPCSNNYEGEPAKADIRSIVKEYEKKGIKTIACAIGSDKKEILSIYGENRFLDITDLSQLPRTMTKKIINSLKIS